MLGERANKMHTLVEVHRSRTQPPPRHLLPRCLRGASISTDIGFLHQKVLNVKIGDLGLKPVKPLSVIQGRMTTSCLTHTMSFEGSLDQEGMVAADDRKNFFGGQQTNTIGNVLEFSLRAWTRMVFYSTKVLFQQTYFTIF